MKKLVVALAILCTLQTAGLMWSWRAARRIHDGPGEFRTLQLLPGESFILLDSTGTIEASLADDKEPRVGFRIQDGGSSTELTGDRMSGRISLSYWHVPVGSQRESGVLMRDSDGDGIPEKKIEKVSGSIQTFRLKAVEWEDKGPNQMPEPTSGSVTPRAASSAEPTEARGARVAPPPPVAHR